MRFVLPALYACFTRATLYEIPAPSMEPHSHYYTSTTVGSLGGTQGRELTAAAHGGRVGLPAGVGVLHHLIGQDHLRLREDDQLHQDQLLRQGGE